jgi:glycosyltransferase involved in cell wall biosynthesis
MFKRSRVIFFQRKPFPINRSVEIIFDDVRKRLADDLQPLLHEFKFFSTGILSRVGIIWESFKYQGDVNHVTGDIHFATIGLPKNKTILTIHDCIMLQNSKGIKHFIFKLFWYSIPIKKSRFVTVVSESTKRELLKYVSVTPAKILVIPNAISTKFIYSQKQFNSSKPVILQVGITENKNIERLAEAIKGIPCHVSIIGLLPEHLTAKLKECNIEYSNYFNLSEDELIEQYNNCDLLSFVSTYEGFGMPIVEANATGRPVITSNVLSMPEVAGNAACIVDPYNVQEIRKGILKIMNDAAYRETLVKNGLENCKRFDPQQIADSYAALYRQIATS